MVCGVVSFPLFHSLSLHQQLLTVTVTAIHLTIPNHSGSFVMLMEVKKMRRFIGFSEEHSNLSLDFDQGLLEVPWLFYLTPNHD